MGKFPEVSHPTESAACSVRPVGASGLGGGRMVIDIVNVELLLTVQLTVKSNPSGNLIPSTPEDRR